MRSLAVDSMMRIRDRYLCQYSEWIGLPNDMALDIDKRSTNLMETVRKIEAVVDCLEPGCPLQEPKELPTSIRPGADISLLFDRISELSQHAAMLTGKIFATIYQNHPESLCPLGDIDDMIQVQLMLSEEISRLYAIVNLYGESSTPVCERQRYAGHRLHGNMGLSSITKD
ncbi:hypothetical protein BDV26DRAFT_299221 [Aspergillus bertholletiae]|uniref:Uncharacterized protein n=1 Tax=Aspergillus bertholletiae TaxID=1226010 RepID=A0A5N7AMD4_9EURO|nr:hypothetical protein BDV26DRAFT_299221 [Aspergillus bertholletiae]